jgi:hypothetical protein
MSRCNTIIAAALAAAALAAPTALAQPPDIHAGLSEPAPQGQTKQDLRSPDTRDAARATTPSDPNAARPETAGNPNVSADAAHSAQAKDDSKNAATDDVTPAEHAALAQERYYMSYGKPTPLTNATRTVAADTSDGIAGLPFVIAVFGALIVGLGTGAGLHLLHARRRHATQLAT